jgi:hypothetical protein
LSAWESFYVIVGSSGGALLIGIYNAWDSVTPIVVSNASDEKMNTD